jgi:hypothetical protein
MSLPAGPLDDAITERVLTAVTPFTIKLALEALANLEQRDKLVSTQWRWRIERLIASTLEKRWNDAMQRMADLEAATYARAQALAEQLERTDCLVALLYGQWAYHCLRPRRMPHTPLCQSMHYDSRLTSKAERLKLGRPAIWRTERMAAIGEACFQMSPSTRHPTHLLAIFFAVAFELATFERQAMRSVTEEQKQQILQLGRDFPRLWKAKTTSTCNRKRMLRLLIRDVTIAGVNLLIATFCQLRLISGTHDDQSILKPCSINVASGIN